MDLDARPYRYFVAIAEHRSFSEAASVMNVSQPALSAQIRELERRLGFKLFNRTGRRVALTEDGRAFLNNARRLILETEWTNQAAREIRTKALTIGAAHFTAQIPERRQVIEKFLCDNRSAPTKIVGRTHAQLLQDIQTRFVEIALSLEPATDNADDLVMEPQSQTALERLALGKRSLALVLPQEHRLASRRAVSLKMMEGQEICSISRAHGIAVTEAIARRIHSVGANRLVPPEGDAVSIFRYAALMRLPAVDLGWFALKQEAKRHDMVYMPLSDANLAISLVAIRGQHDQRPFAQKFWDHISRTAMLADDEC